MLFPYTVFDHPEIALIALILDLLLGDPSLPWKHPVVGIGKLLNFLESSARNLLKGSKKNIALKERLLGGVALFLALIVVGVSVLILISLPLIGYILAIYLAWAGLAMGSLLKFGQEVLQKVENSPLDQARKALSMLVSRETTKMDRDLMRKTLADTLTENFTDALIAPFFWLLLAGPVGLWLYKTVSTMDSMWGYLTPKWRYLGFCGAKSDDLLALIPARISILAAGLTDYLLKFLAPQKRKWIGYWPGFKIIHTQALGMPSPNSGCSMAAFAFLLKIRLGGPSVYFGDLVSKPWLGVKKEEALILNQTILETLLACLKISAIIGCSTLWLIFVLI